MEREKKSISSNLIISLLIPIMQIGGYLTNSMEGEGVDLFIWLSEYLYFRYIGVVYIIYMVNGVIKKYMNDIIITRFKNKNDMFKALFSELFKVGVLSVISLNIVPVVSLFVFEKGLDGVYLVLLILLKQFIFIILLSTLNIVLFNYFKHPMIPGIMSFSVVGMMQIIITSLRINLRGPIDVIFIREVTYQEVFVQTNICLVVIIIIIFMYNSRFKVWKKKDFIWRRENE